MKLYKVSSEMIPEYFCSPLTRGKKEDYILANDFDEAVFKAKNSYINPDRVKIKSVEFISKEVIQ
jgi:hypothetical protein